MVFKHIPDADCSCDWGIRGDEAEQDAAFINRKNPRRRSQLCRSTDETWLDARPTPPL